jgi:MoCo/4Fe-4S cofactor protein with predicted Tat translocation signal
MSKADQCPSTVHEGPKHKPSKQELSRERRNLLSSVSGKVAWRSPDEVADTTEFRDFLEREFPAGITDLFWPHATIHADVPGMRIHPFPLYPVHWQAVADGQSAESRPIHYSFIGACSTPLYISNSRDFILSALKGLPGSLIEGYSGWYYEDHVYRVQIRAELTADDPAVCGAERQQRQERYVQVLQQSVFALCPSGTGPNSIRLWEAIGCGAIPVVLSDRWRPPGSRQLWEQAVLFVPDTAEGVLSIPSLVAACLADGELLQGKRNALRRIWQLYGPRGFTTDLDHLWRTSV